VLVIVRDEQHLSTVSRASDVCRYESQNVVVPEQDGLIDFSFSKPRIFLRCEENLSKEFKVGDLMRIFFNPKTFLRTDGHGSTGYFVFE